MKIIFHGDFPSRYVPEVKAALEGLGPFVEPFISSIRVYFDQRGEGEAAITVLRRYNCANLSLNAQFFAQDSEERETILAHEVAHVLVDPIAREADHIIESFFSVEDPSLPAYLALKLEDAVEKSVDAIGLALRRALRSAPLREGCQDLTGRVDGLGEMGDLEDESGLQSEEGG